MTFFWKLRCRCGKLFELSCNDTVPECRRKCPTCLLADDLAPAKTQLVFKLEETAKTILAWYEAHQKLIWSRVWKACHRRGISDQNFAKELNALCWAKISEKAGHYTDQGFRVSAWLGRVADNTIRDHFKGDDNRQKLAPTVSLDIDPAARATRPEEAVPAQTVRPQGASPNGKNPKQVNWDRRQKWNG